MSREAAKDFFRRSAAHLASDTVATALRSCEWSGVVSRMSNVRCCDVECLMLAKSPTDPIGKSNELDQLVVRWSVCQLHSTSRNSHLTFDNRPVAAIRSHGLQPWLRSFAASRLGTSRQVLWV